MTKIGKYLELPYHIELVRDEDEDGNVGFVAEVEELPGCISQGVTPEEAVASLRDAMESWLSVALEDGRKIPRPREDGHSGKFVVRIPSSLHAELVRAAERENVSLNAFVMSALAGAVGWRRREKAAA